MFSTLPCLLPAGVSRPGHSQGKTQLTAQRKRTVRAVEKAFVRRPFWPFEGLRVFAKEPGEAKGWLMWFCLLLPWAIKGSREKAAAALRCTPVPKRDSSRAVSAGPAVHGHPQQGHEPLHQATDSQAKKLLFFYAHTPRKSLPAYARSSTDLTTL